MPSAPVYRRQRNLKTPQDVLKLFTFKTSTC